MPSTWTVRDYEDTEPGPGGEVGGAEEDDFGAAMDDDRGDVAVEYPEEEAYTHTHNGEKTEGGEKAAASVVAESGCGGSTQKVTVVSPEGGEEEENTEVVPAAAIDPSAIAKPRSRFARMKETNDIAVTAAAAAALRPKTEIKKEEEGSQANGGAADTGKGGNVGSGYMPSLDFQGPHYELSEAPGTSAGSIPSTSSWLQKVRRRDDARWSGVWGTR